MFNQLYIPTAVFDFTQSDTASLQNNLFVNETSTTNKFFT